MRRIVLLFLVGALIVALTAGVALAKDFICEKVTPESCNGTDSADTITGTDQPNTIYGKVRLPLFTEMPTG